MVAVRSFSSAHDLSSLHRISCTLLEKVAGNDRKGNVLVLGHGAVPAPDYPGLSGDSHPYGLDIFIVQGRSQFATPTKTPVDCASSSLPFQDAVFRRVILFLVTRNGTERELKEACRVLAPAGELLVLGLNRSSWSGLSHYRNSPVPRMHVAEVRNSLSAYGMDVNLVLGAGLLGRSGPLMESKRMSGIALPVADLIVLRAGHRERPAATRLQMKEIPARAVPTAVNLG